jgi:hypothetical protein
VLSQVNNIGYHGVENVSDTFGAALWALDFALYAAAGNVSRVHMHQIAGSPLSAWQPVKARDKQREVLPTYYAHLATAAMVGKSTDQVRIVNLQPPSYMNTDEEVAYAAYEHDQLVRFMLINMKEHNSSTAERNSSRYWLKVEPECDKRATISRLLAPGMDSKNNVSFAGQSYSDSNSPKPAIDAPWNDESITAGQYPTFYIDVPYSSAVMVSLDCSKAYSIPSPLPGH